MLIKNLRVLAAASLLLPFVLAAQQSDFHCGANELDRMGDLVVGHPERLHAIDQAKAQLEHFTHTWQGNAARDGEDYVIPVVFHIIHNNGGENISDDQVRDAIRVMNEDFNKMNAGWPDVQPEFLGIVADVGVTFELARLDPDGNCTNGITRTVSDLTLEGNQDMKDLINWPRSNYLNIWVCEDAGGAAGYSMYPSSVSGWWGNGTDGIVVRSDYVGAIGTSSVNRSHTLSHEAGHWLNLKHCWGDSNQPGLSSNCGMDDNVSDTPNTVGWTSCNLNGASCGSTKDNVENFMEYSYCSKMFTNGQKARLLAALNSGVASRNNLWSNGNLALTGLLTEAEICAVSFTSTTQTICAGQSVTFTDHSYNGVSEWSWNFDGGSPAMGTTANPTVTYNTPGVYDVGLTVGDGTDNVGASEQQYITVLPSNGQPLPVVEGFEGGNDLSSTSWSTSDPFGTESFAVSASAAYSGAHAVMVQNFSSYAGRTYEMVSSTIDNTVDPPAVIGFRYAFAKRLNSNEDALRVYASRDCGETWSMRRALIGDELATVANTGGSFIPNGPGDWGYNETSPIGGLYEVSNLRFKFVFRSEGGNNLWLDNININGASVGIEEIGGESPQTLSVMPNPAKDLLRVATFLPEAGLVQVEVLDLLGRPVMQVAEGVRPSGPASWNLDVAALPSGLYLVRLRQENGVRVARFTKE